MLCTVVGLVDSTAICCAQLLVWWTVPPYVGDSCWFGGQYRHMLHTVVGLEETGNSYKTASGIDFFYVVNLK
jgi:hypothetical protein